MEEIWQSVRDYATVYEVSNLGRVRREGRIIKGSQHGTKNNLVINLSYEGKVVRKTLRTVVADAFIPKPPNVKCVKFKDSNKGYCSDNLYWSCSNK